MIEDHRSKTLRGFGRQARAFARSPLHRDPRRLRRLLDFISPRPGESALDVACGPGIVTTALRQQGVRAVGVDLTIEMIAEARVADGGSYVRGDGTCLPFRDGSFDVVLARNALHHLSEPARAVSEMARIVRPGGRVVLEDMQAPDDAAKREYHETIERLRDVAHVRTLTAAGIRTLAERAGLIDGRESPGRFEIDFDEWIDRACPDPANRERARAMVEACLDADRSGLRVWRDAGKLKFERHSLIYGAVRPG